ncbi:unnamed protein product [Cuscuta campestris]|uniref:BED-type domain-containing protein n=1 Tax=Cuscuta campestris TaxID=132261 RepID=A0A484M0G3_9ASTE|nr:unnamed protein product [Cuscuta campestris]
MRKKSKSKKSKSAVKPAAETAKTQSSFSSPSEKLKSGSEIDEFSPGKKRNKPEKASDAGDAQSMPKKATAKEKDTNVRKENGSASGSRARKKTVDGFAVYTEEELGFNKADAGDGLNDREMLHDSRMARLLPPCGLITEMATNTADNKKDPCWKYVRLKDPKITNNTTCIFCDQTYSGGIHRAKQHVVGGFTAVRACEKVTSEVKEEIRNYMNSKKRVREQIVMEKRIQPQRFHDETLMTFGDEDDEGAALAFPEINKRGPMGMFVSHGCQPTANGMIEQKRMNNDALKELRSQACSAIARWMYDAGIPFNAVTYESFQDMIDAIGKHGPGMRAPSLHEVRGPLLTKEVEVVKKEMEDHREEWEKNGELISELLSEFVETVGLVNVVQVVTDNGSNMKLAGDLLMAKYPHLYWTPCATHCLDLILEDIFQEKDIHLTYKKVVKLSRYIYTRPGLVNLLRKFTKLDLVRPGVTRFATVALTLERIFILRVELRTLFVSDAWAKSKWAKEQKGVLACNTILSESFWRGMRKSLKIATPLIEVLRLIDGETKPAMGYIYKAMDRAKGAIAKNFGYQHEKYSRFFDIIDERWGVQLHQPLHAAGHYLNPEYFYSDPNIESNEEVVEGFYKVLEKLIPDTKIQDNITNELISYRKAEGIMGYNIAKRQRTSKPAVEWWRAYGGSVPFLQKFAIKILSLTCSALGCERNWSFFEHVHSKKRKRLDQTRLNDLLFVKYNRALKRHHKLEDLIDPMCLDKIDECSDEWFGGEDCSEETDEEEAVDGLTWHDGRLRV